jgi:hypothetical protein
MVIAPFPWTLNLAALEAKLLRTLIVIDGVMVVGALGIV